MVDITGKSLDDSVRLLAAAINALPDGTPAVISTKVTDPVILTKIDRLEKETFDDAEIAAFPENAPAA